MMEERLQEARDTRLTREYELEQLEKRGEEARKDFVERPKPSKETLRLRQHLKALKDGRRVDKNDLEEVWLS